MYQTMPRNYLLKKATKKYARRKARVAYRKRRYVRRTGPSQGSLYVTRKISKISLSSSGVAGVPSLNDPSGTCVVVGTPVLLTGATATYDVPVAFKFRFDQMLNANELSVLFDRYRLLNAHVMLHNNSANTNGGFPTPWVEYITDHDDAVAPTPAFMREKMGCKNKYFTASRNRISLGCKPVPSTQIYNNGVTTAYGVPRVSPYINMSYTGTEHYGIKAIIHNVYLPATANQSLIDIDVTLKAMCKDVQ